MDTNIEITELPEKAADGSTMINITLSGALTEERYRFLADSLEGLIDKHGNVRIMLLLEHLDGLTAEAAARDLELESRISRKVSRVGAVCEQPDKCDKDTKDAIPLTDMNTRFFPREKIDEAYEWLKSG